MSEFDIVIPVGPNDSSVIKSQLVYTKKNISNYRNIYLVSYDPNLKIKDCITVNEDLFPFSKKTVSNYHEKTSRNGWYLQQLIKFYAGFVIEGILDRYLVIDSDTYFLKKTHFIEDSKCLYNYGNQYHKPYFDHMKRLHSSFEKQTSLQNSGICHHMIFEKKYLKEIFDLVESEHNDKFYNIFLKTVSEEDKMLSGASEYEIYYNYILKNHREEIKIRKLKWDDVKSFYFTPKGDLDYISYHWYQRTLDKIIIIIMIIIASLFLVYLYKKKL